jgi:lipopolysaccharide exporter
MQELDKKMARGALWMVLLRISVRSLGLISTVVLARLLVPADFGLVAMATSVIVLLELATAFSFDVPLIQNANTDREHFDTVWTLNITLYSCLAALLVVLAVPAAAFYHEDRLADVIYVLAIGFLVQGFDNVGVVHFRKELNFARDFWLLFAKKVIGFAVTIPLAFLLRNYWALIAGMVTGNVLGVALTYLLHPFRPRFSLAHAAQMLRFSKWLLFNNGIGFLQTRAADFIVGRLAGSSALGVFSMAFEIATLPTTELASPINRVALPAYSKLAGDRAALRDSYLNLLSVIAFFALPAGLGIAAVAPWLVDLFLGDKWTAAVPIVQLLGVFGAINALTTNAGPLYNGIGKPRTISLLGGIHVVVLLTACIGLVIDFGVAGIAVAYVGTAILMSPVIFFFVGNELRVGLTGIGAVLWRSLLSATAMYGFVRYLSSVVTAAGIDESLSILLIVVPAGALLYVACAVALWQLSGRPLTGEARFLTSVLGRLRSLLMPKQT